MLTDIVYYIGVATGATVLLTICFFFVDALIKSLSNSLRKRLVTINKRTQQELLTRYRQDEKLTIKEVCRLLDVIINEHKVPDIPQKKT